MMEASSETSRAGAGLKRAARRVPTCYYCCSRDTMEPFARSEHVFLLSTLFPRVRVRYCRRCTRHFLSLAPRRRT